MDYLSIVKHAYKITLKNKFLWIFGLFAGGSAGFNWGGGSSKYSFPNSELQNWANSNTTNIDWTSFWTSYGSMIIGILVAFGVISIVLFVLNIISQGALVDSVDGIEKGEKVDFYKGFNAGWQQFWRVWSMGILFLLAVMASLIILIVPVSVLISTEQVAFAIIFGSILFLACLFFWLILSFIAPYALRIVVLKKHSVFDSIREALHLVRNHFVDILVMYLVLLAIGVGFSIIMGLAVALVAGVLLAIGYGFWLASHEVAVLYGLIVGFGVFLSIAVVSAAYSSFSSSVLTLTYLKLTER